MGLRLASVSLAHTGAVAVVQRADSALRLNVHVHLAALGERDGYVVLQPNAVGGLWNAGVDDAKILAFVDQIAAAYHTDPDRVHLTGFSQGGYMTWRVLCRDPSRFASFAPAAAAGAAVSEFLEHDYASASAVGVPPFGVAIVGHCYPGSPDQTVTLPGQLMAFGCTPPTAFDWGEEVLRFFREHPRR